MDLIIWAVGIGFVLDLIFGDPVWMPHPIRLIGWMITKGEAVIRPCFSRTKKGEHIGGTILALIVIGVSFVASYLLLKGFYGISPVLGFVVEAFMCYQILATKCLKSESMKVYNALKKGNLQEARYNVSMIVGRDTKSLDEIGVAKAAIETVAENTSDGIIGPLFFLMIGGAPLGFAYKAVNTLDSMIGYKNEKYQYFGTFGAKLDDVVNYIPARISAYLMMMASWLCKMDSRAAYSIYKRDRYNHKSPNSAHTEAACAGALGIQLAGDAYYFGVLHHKPTIGEATRPVSIEDIKRTNDLMYVTCILGLVFFSLVRILFLMIG